MRTTPKRRSAARPKSTSKRTVEAKTKTQRAAKPKTTSPRTAKRRAHAKPKPKVTARRAAAHKRPTRRPARGKTARVSAAAPTPPEMRDPSIAPVPHPIENTFPEQGFRVHQAPTLPVNAQIVHHASTLRHH
ncbi:MAG: hypothetical protein JNK82_38700 [Myxococcaceae bacterium]|nr:hypothetical protein [Myxococcaceae bacterium]